MDVLAVSSAASPLTSLALKRPVEAPKPAEQGADEPPRAPKDTPVAREVFQQKQLLIEPVQRFAYAYTFVDPETREVVAKWPVEQVIQPGERVELVA
jgi:hypothetical protein